MSKGKEARLKPSKRYPASKKERKRVAKYLEELLGSGASADNVEHVEFKEYTIYVVDGLPCIVEEDDVRYPHLLCLVRKRTTSNLPKVIVDRGATSAVGRGADLMVPGIRRVEGEFSPGDIVVIVDEEANIPVAIGKAIMGSEEILEKLEGERRGKAIKVIHRPGDLLWKLGEAL